MVESGDINLIVNNFRAESELKEAGWTQIGSDRWLNPQGWLILGFAGACRELIAQKIEVRSNGAEV